MKKTIISAEIITPEFLAKDIVKNRSELEIAKENKDKIKNKGYNFYSKKYEDEQECIIETHKETCKRWLEWMEANPNYEDRAFRDKIKELKQAIEVEDG
jgi:hypothetical protein